MFSSYTRTRTVQPAGLAPTFGVRYVHWTVSSVFTSASSGARTGQSVLSLLFVWDTYWTVGFVFTFRLGHVLDSRFCLYFSSGTRTGQPVFSSSTTRTGQSVLSLLFVWDTYWTVGFVFTFRLGHVLDSQSFRQALHVLDSQICL